MEKFDMIQISSKYELRKKDVVNPGYSARRRSLCRNICW